MDAATDAEPRAPAHWRALVVDDDKNIRVTLAACLESIGFEVVQAASGPAAFAALATRPYDIAFLDLRLSDADGLELLPRLVAECPGLSIVIVTAYATVDTAVRALKGGAADYLPKPFTPEQIRLVVRRIVDTRGLQHRLRELEDKLREGVPEVDLDTDAPALRAVLGTIARAARSDAPVLLRGESGTGKGVLARALHAQSARSARPFVVVNCPTLSEELLASELFGHVRGSFTGAVRDQPGRVEAAEGGTLFLDEIAEIAPALQAKLLRFVQDKEFERVGETHTRHADVRIVAATNRHLAADVAAGRFREDLYWRLAVVEIDVPPLRERPEDVLRLARSFLAFFDRAANRRAQSLSPEAARALAGYAWPGNVRELRNAMERCAILWPADVVEPAGLPERIAGAAHVDARVGDAITLEELERQHIARVLARAATLEDAARILGIDESTLWRKRKRYGF